MTEKEHPGRIPMDLDLPVMEGSEVGAGFETTDLGYCLVTGAAGFLGRRLVFELIRRGEHVRAFDCVDLPYSHERLGFVKGDVRRFEDTRKACEGIDTVFHAAAALDFYGFATREQRDRSHGVNVEGVENVVRACAEAGVQRLVHTSSNNVTFGDPVIDGDETDAYASNPKDLYTETKILGEKAALAGNGHGRLLTCAIRPGGIYGPGDQLVLPRVVEECASGKFVVTIGDGTALSDNTYIDNLVDGEIEAARHLLPGSRLCGEAYFITDGDPINYFDFFRPLVEAMGFEFPKMKIPASLLYGTMSAWEFLHWAIKIPPPLLTRLEVRKITVSHYSRIEKAKRDFGWTPKVSVEEARAKCVEYCKELLEKRQSVDRPHWGWWGAILSGMAFLGVLAFDAEAHAVWSEAVTTWTPRGLLQGVFVWAVSLHVYKGMKAVRMAERAGLHETSMSWGWQTFALGFASLSLLEKRIEQMRIGPGGDDGSRAIRTPRDSNESREAFLSPSNRRLLAAITAVHRFLYLSSGGLIGGKIFWIRILLLINVGRKTGRTHRTPLLYVEDGDRWIVVASNGGHDRHPAWWYNLQGHPEVRVQVGREQIDARWRRATSEECYDLWPKLVASYPYYPDYLARTKRAIPILILERADDEATIRQTASAAEAIAS
jgi:3beta-hydroxy-delta5-steroid dehydrogenase/steroid delta-isomerase